MMRILFALAVLAVSTPPSQGAQTVYTLSVVPQFTAVDIGQRWTPLLDRIRAETGITFQIRTSANIPDFENEFLGGIPDFVYLNPYHMVMAAKAQHYRPLVRSRDGLSGILVVSQEGSIRNVKDLQGATLAFPAPNAFGASLYMRALLSEQEKLDYTAAYVGTHQNVYRHVIYGDALAGGGVDNTWEREPESVRKRLRIVYRTPVTAAHPLAVHPRIRNETVDKLMAALKRLATTPEGQQLLRQVELDNAVSADYARDYAPLDKLKLERYVVIKQK